MNRTKPLIAALCFVTALLNIVIHTSDYRHNRRPSGLRLVVATLGIISGVLTMMSDALDKERVRLPELHVRPKAKPDADSDPAEDEFGDDLYDLSLGCDASGSCDLCFEETCVERQS